jgi:hypothetical protein
MTYDDLIGQLRARLALIVHFSHHANMREGGVFPDDLLAAIAHSRSWPLSCCVIWPAHEMSLPGSVGVILRPRSLASIIAVSSTDAGSLTFGDGSEGSLGSLLSQETFTATFEVPADDYNEWRIVDADAVGIYFEEPLLAKKRKRLTVEGIDLPEMIAAGAITLDEVHRVFPDLPVMTRHHNRLVATNIPGKVIYP